MRILVTGASGFVGRNLLLALPTDWEVWATHHQSEAFPRWVADRGLAHVRPWRCDLTDPAQARALAHAIGPQPEAIVALAANSDPTVSAQEPWADLLANAGAMVHLLDTVPSMHLIFFSSGAVYDGLEGPVAPGVPLRPRLPYAISKLAAEQYIQWSAMRRGSPGRFTILRFFGAFGPYEPMRKITTRWLTALRQGQREFTIRGDGQNLIDLMYVDDAVDAVLRVLGSRGESAVIDLASGAPRTLDALAAALREACSTPVTIRHQGRVEEYIRFRSIDPTMSARFGWSPSVPFVEGLRRLNRHLAAEAAPPPAALSPVGKGS